MPVTESHGLAIHYEVTGSGPPVILLHSFLCSGEMWRDQIEPLGRSYRLVNIDLRGHGRSGNIAEPFTLYDLVDDAAAVLDDLEIDRAAWAGLSIGGMISLRAARRIPDRVSALLLLDTDAGPEKAWVRLKYGALGLVARTIGLAPIRGQVVRQMFGATARRARRDLVAEWAEQFTSVHVPSALLTLDALVARDDLTGELAGIERPALVLVGDEDASLPPVRSRALAAGLPDAELVEIPQAGHLSALEQPEKVTRAMQGFLARVAAQRPAGAT